MLSFALKRSLSFYLVLFLVIAPLYVIPHFAWAYVLYSLWHPAFKLYSARNWILFCWLCSEVIFSIYYRLQMHRVNTTIPKAPTTELDSLRSAFKRILQAGMAGLPLDTELEPLTDRAVFDADQNVAERGSAPRLNSPVYPIEPLRFDDPRAVDYREYMRTWFHKKPWAEIHTHEMRQWLYWAIFNRALPPPDQIPATHSTIIEEALVLIEQRSGTTLKEGSNPQCKPVLLTLDPVTIHFRPLVFYTLVWVFNRLIRSMLVNYHGFQYARHGQFEYLIRRPSIANTRQRPLVFIHGLGLGLFQYQALFRFLSTRLPSHRILIPLQPHISQDIFHPHFLHPLTPRQSVEHISEVIESFGWDSDGVDLLSHSNGTFFHAWLLKYRPNLIKRSCLVDPVTFCTWEGDLCYNFLYQPCLTGIQVLMRYFVGSELGVVNVLHRHFNWSSNSLWFEDIPNALDPEKTVVLLGGRDVITNMERIRRYLRSHGITKGIWFDPEGRHGTALMNNGKGIELVLRWVRGTKHD